MCQTTSRAQEARTKPGEQERDVDDLIFRDEPGWQSSDR